MKRVLISAGLLLFTAAGASSQQFPSADLVILHGRVWTVDGAHPQAEALAIHGSRIIAVGSDADIVKWTGPGTR